jgi:hypothetical protein
MRAVLELEFIGENYFAYQRSGKHRHEPTERFARHLGNDQSRPWVKRIIGYDPHQQDLIQMPVDGQIDYSRANGTGSRGVRLYFILTDGIYEVNERETWKRVRRYFIRVEGTRISEIERDEVMQCLSGK